MPTKNGRAPGWPSAANALGRADGGPEDGGEPGKDREPILIIDVTLIYLSYIVVNDRFEGDAFSPRAQSISSSRAAVTLVGLRADRAPSELDHWFAEAGRP
jgi:hypothetical protein